MQICYYNKDIIGPKMKNMVKYNIFHENEETNESEKLQAGGVLFWGGKLTGKGNVLKF